MSQFHPFVIPFCAGVIILFSVCAIKFYRWFKSFDRLQRAIVKKNILSWKIFPAIWETFLEALIHRKISRQNLILGYMHRSIAFGWFLLIVVGAIECEVALKGGITPWTAIFFRYFNHNHDFTGAKLFTFVMDALLLYVLSGIFLAFCKMFYSRIVGMKKTTKHTVFDRFAKFSLWAIFPLRLISESLTANIYHNGGFLTQNFGNIFSPWFAAHFELVFWTLYSIALGTFFVSLPFSRYMHIFTEVFLIYFRNMGVKENEKKSGYTMLELSACSRCGICIDNCPLNKDLHIQGVQSVYFLREMRYKRLTESISNNCLLCARCASDCPVGIDLMSIRQMMRNKGELDKSDKYQYISNVQSFNSIGRVIYFAGCMSHLTPGIIEAMQEIFKAVGQKYWFMDEERTICCGRPLRQQGFNEQAKTLRRKNTELIKESGASLLVTSCPICYQSFTKEYNLPIRVMHHSEYIDMLIQEGRLQVNKSAQRITYHDPCELGRSCGIYKAPREVLESVATLLRTKNEQEKSLCCGFNLGDLSITSEDQRKIRDAAFENLTAPAPDMIATSCPMCKKAFKHGNKFPVKDIAEIVAENIHYETSNQ